MKGMNEKDRELMERYIYQVVRRLPKEQREEVTMELQELISDMQEGSTMEQVLQKLGDPAVFARKYRDENSFLIGPEYYDNYLWVLKMCMIACIIAIIVSSAVQTLFQGVQGDMDHFIYGQWIGDCLTGIIVNAFSVFGVVTLIFAALEHRKVKVNLIKKEQWQVKDLSSIPNEKALISRGDSVVSIVFISLFSGILIFAPQLLGVYIMDDGKFVRSICLFDLANWNVILPIFLVSLGVGLTDEIIRLVTGHFCKAVMYCTLICNGIQIALAVVLFKVMNIMNPFYEQEIAALGGNLSNGSLDILRLTGQCSGKTLGNVLLIGIVMISLIEIGVTVYKTLRYGMDMK